MQNELKQLEKKHCIGWQEYKIGELFEINRGNISKQGELVENIDGIAFVAQNDNNNGFVKLVEIANNKVFTGKTIVIGRQTGVVYYQPERFVTTDGVLVLSALTNFIKSDKIGLYLTANIQKQLLMFGYTNTVSATKLKPIKITLPTANSEIAFAYIEEFLATLDAERLATLDAYLTTTNLKDYTLTEEESEALEKIKSVKWGEFKIGDLFEIRPTKKKFNAQGIEFGGKYRYIARGESNNGIRGYIDEDEQYLNDGKTISFGQDTATIFYQEEPYFTGDKIKVFKSKNNIQLNREIAQFFISSMKKAFSNFSWGSSSYNVAILNSTKIILPLKPDLIPDFSFMATYIKAMQKIVIKNVIEWADKRIEKTKEVVDRK
jgi:hypothetical protein